MKYFKKNYLLFFIVFIFLFTIPGLTDNAKKPLTHDVYDSWRVIRNSKISQDGSWVLYLETPQDGDGKIIVLNSETEKRFSHTIGYTGEKVDSEKNANPQFSYDEKYVVFLISKSQNEIKEKEKKNNKKKEKKDKNKIKNLGIMNLDDGEVTVVERVKIFSMPEENGNWLAYLKEKPEEKKKEDKENQREAEKEEKKKKESEKKEEKGEKKDKKDKKKKKKKYGTELIVKSLKTDKEISFESVLSYKFMKNGEYLFYTVSCKDKPETDGVYAYNLKTGEKNVLLKGKGDYKKLELNKDEDILAFITNRDDYEAEQPTYNLYGCEVGAEKADLWVSHKSTKNFPENMAVSDKSGLSFSDDGKVVMFGIKEIPEKKDEEKDKEKKAKFDLWHWKDPYPQPQQKKMAKRVKNNTWESVYFINKGKFVKLADEEIHDVSLNRKGEIAFGQTNLPYAREMSYFGRFNDVYVVDTKTGEKTLVKKHLFGYRGAQLSPDGNYVIWFEKGNWHVYDINKKTTKNITKGLDVSFAREDHDRPEPSSSYGIAGWTEEEKHVLIYDRFDIWKISPDGVYREMMTEGFGRKNNLSFRNLNLDPDKKLIDPDKKLLLMTTNEKTMVRGFYNDKVAGNTLPEKLIMEDKRFGYPRKAENKDILLYSRMAFDEYPDLWISGMEFKNTKKMTDLGTQMDPYIWGKAELIDFFSSDGKPLKGILVKPDNFDPNKKYPLMVYIYETLHNYMYNYFRHPSPGSSMNPSYYVSNGYIIWMPDIEYHTGYPGQDALKCVLPGIQLLIRKGFIDKDAVGIQGHSWGGYQIAYMITQTNMFAAVEAGAPVSNMTSAYGGIRWGSGMVRQFQYEQTQSRIGGSLWEYPMRYINNSPLFFADRVETPIMMMHNDEDGAVPWYQGIEYIMALRRLNKEAYMFNYKGEKHGLRKRINQIDWTKRLAEFFDHHLKGAPKPDWMKEGIKAWEKD